MNKKLIRKMLTAAGGPLFPWQLNTEWVNNWKFRTTPASRSRVLSGKGVETDKQYTERRKKETTKRTWRSDAADIAHGIGEGVLALHPYTAIPYFGAKVGLDFLNGTYGWHTALNASIPLFHMAPQSVGLREATNVALEDVANAGSKTARNWRVAREINQATKNKPNIEVPKPIIRTKVGDVEIDNPQLFYRQGSAEMGNDFIKSGVVRTSGGFENPMYTEGALFRKVPTRTKGGLSKGDKVALDGPYSKNKSDLLVTDSSIDMIPANQGSGKNYAWFEDYMSDPFAEESIFDRSRVPLFDNTATSTNTTIYRWKPRYGYRLVIKEPLTSLKFFERKPAKISEAERLGVPKGERNNVNNSGNLERTVNNIILENKHWLPKETGMFAQKHSSVGSSYRKIFEELWGKENTDRLTDDLLGKLILIRNRLIDTNIPLKGDFVYVVDGQAKAYRNGLEIGYLSNSYINNGKALHPEMVKKQGTNNAGVSELLYNGTILAENRPIISGSRLLMPEVTTHIWSKYPTRKLISTKGVHAWPLRTAQEKGIKLNYEKNWHTLPEFSKLHQLALDENIRTNLIGLPIYELSEPSYLPMVKNARVFDISLLRDGYINLDFTPGFAYKQGGKMNTLLFLKNGSGIHIKKKNRGKFTDYCGGKVTSECIAKGKKSPNAAIRKRATFAANARKWKHKEGGKAFVNGVSILDSNPDAYKYVKKKYKMALEGTKLTFGLKVGNFLNSDLGQFAANAAGQFVNGIWQNKQLNKIKNELNQWKKSYINSITPEDYSLQVAAEEQQLMLENPDYNSSPIVQAYKNNILANNSLAAAKLKAEQEANQVIANYQLNNNLSSFNWGNLLSLGLGLAGQYLSNKKLAT